MILARVHNVFKDLTAAEQKIASYVLSAPEKVIHMTAKALAAACGTAPSAVIRMCKSLELDGFSELKILLARDIGKAGRTEMPAAFTANDTPEAIFDKVFRSGIDTLHNTLEMLNFSTVRQIAEKLLAADRILIFGIGTSSVVAVDAQYRLSQLGLHAYAYTDILYMNVMAMNMQPTDVAIGISHSGTTKSVVDAMRHAKNAGAQTVAITSFTKSLLFREAALGLSVYADEENYPIEAVSARIAHICVIDALMMTLASMKYDDFSEHISLRNKALGEIRY